MTLQQAHEIQRRELISLRAENARLKKQSSALFPQAEKDALERRIKHLEQVIKTNETRHESATPAGSSQNRHAVTLRLKTSSSKNRSLP